MGGIYFALSCIVDRTTLNMHQGILFSHAAAIAEVSSKLTDSIIPSLAISKVTSFHSLSPSQLSALCLFSAALQLPAQLAGQGYSGTKTAPAHVQLTGSNM